MTTKKLYPPSPTHPFTIMEFRKLFSEEEGVAVSNDICRIRIDPNTKKFIGEVFSYNGESLEKTFESNDIGEVIEDIAWWCPAAAGPDKLKKLAASGEWDFMREENPVKMLKAGMADLKKKEWTANEAYLKGIPQEVLQFYSKIMRRL